MTHTTLKPNFKPQNNINTMLTQDPITTIRAFAEVYGFDVLSKEHRLGEIYTLAKRLETITAPLCPYMLPHVLVVWIDGYKKGLKGSAAAREI